MSSNHSWFFWTTKFICSLEDQNNLLEPDIYIKRGINDLGYSANDVGTQQIIHARAFGMFWISMNEIFFQGV